MSDFPWVPRQEPPTGPFFAVERSEPRREFSDAMREQFKAEIDAGYKALETTLAQSVFVGGDTAPFVDKRTRWQKVTHGTRYFVNGWRERIAHWIWPYGWDDGY